MNVQTAADPFILSVLMAESSNYSAALSLLRRLLCFKTPKKVLVVDLDFHKKFINAEIGISNINKNDKTPREVILEEQSFFTPTLVEFDQKEIGVISGGTDLIELDKSLTVFYRHAYQNELGFYANQSPPDFLKKKLTIAANNINADLIFVFLSGHLEQSLNTMTAQISDSLMLITHPSYIYEEIIADWERLQNNFVATKFVKIVARCESCGCNCMELKSDVLKNNFKSECGNSMYDAENQANLGIERSPFTTILAMHLF